MIVLLGVFLVIAIRKAAPEKRKTVSHLNPARPFFRPS
jgi:hypothetical protein